MDLFKNFKYALDYIKYLVAAVALISAANFYEVRGGVSRFFKKAEIEIPFTDEKGFVKGRIPFGDTIVSAAGQNFKISDLKDKVVVVLFSGTWCPNCPAAAKSIDQVAEELRGKSVENVKFVMIYIGEDSIEDLKEHNAEHGIKNLEVNQAMHVSTVRAVPLCLVYNKKGEQVFAYLGARNFSDPRFVKFINELSEE